MSYGICNLSIIPCRKEPSDKAEMVTQLLFGEHYQIIKETEKWCYIRNAYDGYESWIDKKQMVEINAEEFDHLSLNNFPTVGSIFSTIQNPEKNQTSYALLGSTLPWLSKNRFKIYNTNYIFEGELANAVTSKILSIADKYLNVPYLWGGRSPFGIDCSGFTQMVFKMVHVKLPRDAYQQADCGESISLIKNLKSSDLLFFSNSDGKVIHVGIAVDKNYVIHASGKVRIDKINEKGILNVDSNNISHHFHSIKRIV